MPKAMERALKKVGRERGYKGERLNHFVYGTMVNHGWRPNNPGGQKTKRSGGKKK